jgi:hypothetical protein
MNEVNMMLQFIAEVLLSQGLGCCQFRNECTRAPSSLHSRTPKLVDVPIVGRTQDVKHLSNKT